MTKRLYLLGFLVTALIGFLILSEHSQQITSRISKVEPNTADIEKEIHKGLKECELISKQLLSKSRIHGIDDAFKFYSDSLSKELAAKGIQLFLFRNGKLIFWSQSMDVENLVNDSTSIFLKDIQNAWYIGRWETLKTDKVLALLKVKSSYPYQNKFLKNDYNERFKALKGYEVTLNKDEIDKQINISGELKLNLIRENVNLNETSGFLKSFFQWLTFVFLIVFVIVLFQAKRLRDKPSYLILLIIILLAFRWLGLNFDFPNKGLSSLFSPEVYAHTNLSPSLGDFLVNALLVFTVIALLYRNIDGFKIRENSRRNRIYCLLLVSLVFGFYLITDSLFKSLVMHSTITLETYRIFNLSMYSLIGYIAISLWFISSMLITDLWLKLFLKRLNLSTLGVTAVVGLLVVVIISILIDAPPSIYGILWCVMAFGIIFYLRVKGNQVTLPWYLILLSVISLYSVVLVSDYTFIKDKEVRKVLAINLSNERDPVAEVQFGSLVNRLEADTAIHRYIDNIQGNDIEMFGYLQNKYFNGYFKKYDFRATVCYPGSDLIMDNTDSKVDCYGFFNDIINVFGINIPGTSFYFLNMQNGRINYIGYADCKYNSKTTRLYIEFDSKLSPEQFGYPELLLEGKLSNKSKISEYSTAKYHQDQLLAQTGDYSYKLENPFDVDSAPKFCFINQGLFNHLVYRNDHDDVVVLSKPRETILNTTASFAYAFIFFSLIIAFWLKVALHPLKVWNNVPSFKKRIKTAMILIVIVSLILVASVSIIYSIKSFENKSIDNLSEKLLSVMIEVDRDFVKEGLLTPANSEFISNKLVQLSNVFYSDINIYDIYGILLSTSRPEIFERHLQGRRMNPEAWHEMAYNHSQKLIHQEQIGSMSFYSAYVPLVDQNSNVIGYLNLPYFTRQGEFVDDLYSIIVAIINIFTLITLVALTLAIVISNQISKPLELIREKIRSVDISSHNEPIRYDSNDELGQLVKEYNRMVIELADSAEKLARSQRESAWREMAKQIAHEIKNPLTPMKLSIQHLIRAKKEEVDGWDAMFQKFSISLIDQINALSNIATEFSNFAKMPVTSVVVVNMNSVIDEVITLFSGYSNLQLKYINSCGSSTSVDGDREQIFRVFVNLVKNAVQSIEKGKNGEITIKLSCAAKWVTISIEDNGKGIPEDIQPKLFSPNFTTKSGGMGLGLAIVKGIVENTGGRIWFETELGIGTKFFIELPLGTRNQ